MSLILDALSRARVDATPMPGLTTHHAVEPVAVNRRQYLLWVALSVAVVVIAWLVLERYSAPPPVESVHVPVESAQQPVEQPSAPASLSPQSVSQETSVAAVNLEEPQQLATDSPAELLPEVTPAVEHPDAAPAEAEELVAMAQNEAVAELYRNPPKTEALPARKPAQQSGSVSRQSAPTADTSKPAAEPIDVDRLLRMAREEVANDHLMDHPVPFLIDLSQQIKDSIPTVHYLRHDYSSDASRSTVVLNSKTLHVGGSPVSGMKVEEILPDSVVLNYQGTQFRLRALNSWVNL